MFSHPANLGTLVGGVLAVAVVLLFVPTATAGCGDYVHVAVKNGPTETPRPAPCACEHGQCHAPIPLAPLGEPTTAEPQPPVDALMLADPSANSSRSARRLPDSERTPSRTSSGVFHPPRG